MRSFERLQKRFSTFEQLDSLDEEVKLDEVMMTAGRALHAAVKHGETRFEAMPAWMTKPPIVETSATDRAGNSVVVHETYWNTYWWHAVLWIAKNCSEAGVPLPTHPASYLDDNDWDHFSGWVLPAKCDRKMSDKSLCRLWREIAAASADTCAFLANTDPKPPVESPSVAKPVEFTRSVSLNYAASQWFHVDPRTLKKMIANGVLVHRPLRADWGAQHGAE